MRPNLDMIDPASTDTFRQTVQQAAARLRADYGDRAAGQANAAANEYAAAHGCDEHVAFWRAVASGLMTDEERITWLRNNLTLWAMGKCAASLIDVRLWILELDFHLQQRNL